MTAPVPKSRTIDDKTIYAKLLSNERSWCNRQLKSQKYSLPLLLGFCSLYILFSSGCKGMRTGYFGFLFNVCVNGLCV